MPAPIVAALLAVAIAVARHKLVDATGGVHQLRFAGIERVTRVRDLKLDKRILNAVDFDRVLRSCRRTAEELSTVRHIFENYYAVVIRMNSLFHCLVPFENLRLIL